MPNYDYICETCGDIEIHTSIVDRDRQICPECDSSVERKITFNGSVWSPTSSGANHK